MATVRDILKDKGSQVLSIGPDATVFDGALVMNEHKIGALVVTRQGRVAGIFTERDVLRRVVGEGREPKNTTIAEVMTHDVICCDNEMKIDDVRAIMKERRVRHLPVVNGDNELLGVVSIGDVSGFRVSRQEVTIKYLEAYLYGQV